MKKLMLKLIDGGDLVLIEQVSFNDRSLVAWYDSSTRLYALAMFHVDEKVNKVAKHSPYTTWGYVTRVSDGMTSAQEASEVIGHFMKDMLAENYWWEND
jgi:hypothetical protein